jgi:integrase
MSLKNSRTTADYLHWNDMIVLVQKLERDVKNKLALLISIGSYTGLRISDLLTLRYEQFINRAFLELREKKTGKYRKIKINEHLSKIVTRLFKKDGFRLKNLVLLNNKTEKAYTPQHFNRQLKNIKYDYRIDIDNFSTHTLRKTFGRHIWEQSGHSEKAITLLSDIFNHSNYRITRRYLGINEDDINSIYDLL